MSSYKLVYFNGRGRAEVTRLLFEVAKQDYEDKRVTKEEFGALKPTLPFGQLPVLEVDGVTIPQSSSIERFVAKKLNLFGSNDIEGARIDALFESVLEVVPKYFKAKSVEGEEAKAAALKSFFEETIASRFAQWDNIFKANNSSYFVGNSITLADIKISQFYDFFDDQDSINKQLAAFPKLVEHRQRVNDNEQIAAWIKKRPQTPF